MSRSIVVVLLVALVLGVSCNGFHEDELACEQAVAHLDTCCPEVARTIRCEFVQGSGGCDGAAYVPSTYPDLDTYESKCLRKKSCDELRARYCPDLAGDHVLRCTD